MIEIEKIGSPGIGKFMIPKTNTWGFGTFGNTETSASAFGFSSPKAKDVTGTAIIKFHPRNSNDTIVRNGQTIPISTRQHCITAMDEYKGKGLDELRLEDYSANRKVPRANQGGDSFGSTHEISNIFCSSPVAKP